MPGLLYTWVCCALALVTGAFPIPSTDDAIRRRASWSAFLWSDVRTLDNPLALFPRMPRSCTLHTFPLPYLAYLPVLVCVRVCFRLSLYRTKARRPLSWGER